MQGSHTPLLLCSIIPARNMGSRTIGACSQVICKSFLKYTTITVAHSAYFSHSHSSLGLTLLPSRLILCVSGSTRDHCGGRNLPCHFRLYLRVGYRLFPLHQLVGLFRCRFALVAPATGITGDTLRHENMFCLLTGIHLYNVPWRLWKVKDSNLRRASLFYQLSAPFLSVNLPCCCMSLRHSDLITSSPIPYPLSFSVSRSLDMPTA